MSTGNIGQTQIRMVTPTTPRIGQTTIRPTTPIRIQNAIQAQRMAGTNITPIRAGQTTIVQTNNLMPALHPVSGTTIMSGTNQVILHFKDWSTLFLMKCVEKWRKSWK